MLFLTYQLLFLIRRLLGSCITPEIVLHTLVAPLRSYFYATLKRQVLLHKLHA